MYKEFKDPNSSGMLKPEQRRLDIQAMRAIAVTAVIAYHADLPVPGGFSGVDVFFVISGYVITKIILGEWNKTGELKLLEFYFKRLKRLMPALLLVVFFTLTVGMLFISPLLYRDTWLTGVSALLMSSNVSIASITGGYFNVDAIRNPLLNTWSLSVEEQFYLFFPTVILMAINLDGLRNWKCSRLFWWLFIVALVSFTFLQLGLLGIVNSSKLSKILGFYSPLVRAWEFVSGALLCLFLVDKKINKSTSSIFGVIGVAALLLSFFYINDADLWPSSLTILPVIGAVCLILSGSNDEFGGILGVISRNRIVAYLGDISYSWYLWHWPFIVIAGNFFAANYYIYTMAAVISLLPAIAAYRWLENPIRNSTFLSRKEKLFFCFLLLAILVSISYFSRLAYESNYWSTNLKMVRDQIEPLHLSNASGCGQGFVPLSKEDKSCTWNEYLSGQPVYLIGDSNADHVSEAVVFSAEKLGRSVQIVTKGGCSFLGRSWSDQGDIEGASCVEFVDKTLGLLTKSPPGLVIIGLSDSIWKELGKVSVGINRESEISDLDASIQYLLDDYVAKVINLKSAGHDVLLLLPAPKFVTLDNKLMFDNTLCSTLDIIFGKCPKEVVTTIEYQKKLQSMARSSIQRVAEITKSEQLDLFDFVCKEDSCSNINGQLVVYRDAGHLTVSYSYEMSSFFLEKLTNLSNKSKSVDLR
jgi:peptidoglycan/LPS O-acetylase OafA/YrhL